MSSIWHTADHADSILSFITSSTAFPILKSPPEEPCRLPELELRTALFIALAKSTASAISLATAIKEGQLPADVKEEVLWSKRLPLDNFEGLELSF